MSKKLKYKETGLPWCPLIPEDWEMKKLKYLANLRDETIEDSDFKIAVENIESGTGKLVGIDVEKNYQGSLSKFNRDDIIFNKLRPYLHKVYFAEKDGGLFGELLVLDTLGELLPKFLFYKLFDKCFIDVVDGSTQGTKMPRANWEGFIKELSLTYPKDKKQQQNITAFLDQKTAEIGLVISKKQKLIEYLKEERISIINEAVTKGTTANVAMRESGIDWLGEIPKHWEVKKLKYVLAEIKGALKPGPFGSDLKNSDLTPNSEYKVYTQRNVIDNDFEVGEDYISQDKFQLLKVFEVNENDILITTRGTIGKSVIVPKEFQKGIIHPCLIRVTLNQELVFNKFLQLFFNESSYFLENVKLNSNSTIIDVIYGNTLREVYVPVPPKDEQIQITNVVEVKAKEIDNTIEKIEQEIVLINEYRTSLINEVVTGKTLLN